VRHLSEEPLDRFAMPRKVTVYAAKWPGDEDHERGMKYFRKYVKVRNFFIYIYLSSCTLLLPVLYFIFVAHPCGRCSRL
jgi:hypothetical protein